MNIGFKLGFSFKKSKKHAAIDKKFDEVFIPKATKLQGYFKTIDSKKIEDSRHLRMAYRRSRMLNHSILWRYKWNYSDTVKFYSRIDTLFHKIDELIIKAN
ncbi:MAG: hypothetical protein V4565_02880 [Bacteroidota bacterium]